MRKNVVIIDDDEVTLHVVSESISFVHPDYIVSKILVRPGTDVVRLLPARVDVFLVDSDLHFTTGPAVIRLFAKTYPKARIIGWSADLTSEKVQTFQEAGATEVTEKKGSVDGIANLVG